MEYRSRVLRTTALGAVVAFAACSDNAPITAPDVVIEARQGAVFDLAAVAKAVPSFGGMYLAEDGTPTVYLTNPAEQPRAERALSGWLKDLGAAPSAMRVRRGDFTYAQLDRWTSATTPEALDAPGAVYVDLDEASNRVRVGIEAGTSVAAIRGIIARLGIPDGAVIITETEPVVLAATLQDMVRPVQGGLQIHWDAYVCTIGFNAISGGTSSFITNSHCSGRQGGVQGTLYNQPSRSVANSFIGTEVADPDYFRRGVCPKGRKCRYSDSSRASYAAGVTTALGVIARTTGANNNSLEIAGTFTITAENTSSTFTVGSTANKVGRTSGWTQGLITNTCVHTNVSGSSITQLCQTFVTAGVVGGDSGSPVFAISSGTNVTLLGILWGGSGSSFVFSPLGAIEQELGALTTF